ncbi:MAG: hypothetical protein ACO1O1_10285 [Adhaeribacter sp.]
MADNSALLIWEKIQPVPVSKDLTEALRGEVRDPLWLLARQWQLGEFQAEDAGMAASAQVVTMTAPLQAFAASGEAAAPVAYQADDKPLNALTEQVRPALDLSLRLEAGRKWRLLLTAAGKTAAWETFRQNPLLHFKLPVPAYGDLDPEQAALSFEPYAQMLASLANGRMVDGGALFRELQTRSASDFLAQPDPEVNELGAAWLQWVKQHLHQGLAPEQVCWDASRLEYRAAAAAPLPEDSAVALQLPEHHGQLMDSFSWELGPLATGLQPLLNPAQVTQRRQTFIPTPVSFPAMPRARWWEFEDSTIDLGNLQARKTDLGLLLLSEFGLLYSNDWLLLPLPLPAGHLARIRSIRVQDVFGVQSMVKPAVQDANWELFQLGTPVLPEPKGWLFLPPTAPHFLEGPNLEEVHLLRDEMANMVWGVEQTVPDGLGEGTEGRGAALRLEQWLQQLAGQDPGPEENPLPDIGAAFQYTIGTTVPAHWIPFIPFRPQAGSPEIVFRRAAMPRFAPPFAPTRIRPRTEILRSVTGPSKHYDIREEEIPAAGVTLRQVWRRSRWYDGSTFTWLAREKSIGRHAASSGLQFDQIR